ncbi:GxxExxY protein [Fodinibius salsisoli]|uniref:GxxExxY protein n=1 Tax=Fodinibius salsisoli TaxID=2820877 RepID=A0ABT3PPI5_9BACT|nr:GxxExxY protein [Fodinibius salsisoli]MCW9707751.1 GxxExxY protein [Fodinibius salsisoli]
MKLNDITHNVIKAAIEVHKQLGPGLLESAYQQCLAYEINESGLLVEEQVPVPVIYKKIHLEHGYRLDLLIDKKVVVELKTVETLTDVHTAQLLTYLRLGNYKVGLLINFDVNLLKNGLKRFIN